MVNKKIQLQDDGVNLLPLATLNGIDINNVLANGELSTYTATQDCIATTYKSSTYNVKINNINVFSINLYGSSSNVFLLKKGQTISFDGTNANLKVYGIKR